MGVLHYALNHTRKEVYALGKTIYFNEDRLPRTFAEMHDHVWAEINPEENFVCLDWGTPERAEKIAKELWKFGVEGYVSDTQDELIEEKYANYVYTGSIYEGDEDIGKFMRMDVNHENGTMIVRTENGYERRRIAEIEIVSVGTRHFAGRNRLVPELHEREEIYSHVGSDIPFVRMKPIDPMQELDDLHRECLAISERCDNQPHLGMSYSDQIKISRYYELLKECKTKLGL